MARLKKFLSRAGRLIFFILLPVMGVSPAGLMAQNHPTKQKADSLEIIKLEEKFEMHLKGNQLVAARRLVDSMLNLSMNAGLPRMAGRSYFNAAMIEKAAGNTESFITNLQNAVDWYMKAGARLAAARAYTVIGQTMMQDNFQEALNNFMASLALRKSENDSLGITNNHVNIGGMHYQMGNYTEANHYFYQALTFADRIGSTNLKAYALLNISNIHNKLKNFDVSHDYLKQVLNIHRKTGNRRSEANALMAIGNTYFEQGNMQEAGKHYNEALILIKTLNDSERGHIQAYNNLGLVASRNGDTLSAISFFNQALALSKKTNDKQGLSIALSNLGPLMKKENKKSSLAQIRESLDEAKALKLRKLILSNYGSLRDYYGEAGDYKSAYEYAMKYEALNDSIYNEDNANTIIGLQKKYETAEKEKELAVVKKEKLEQELELNKANTMKYGMLIVSGLLLLLLGTLYSRYLIKRRTQLQLAAINEKLNLLNTTKDKLFSIVSHDLKNSMSGFSGIVNTLNRQYDNFSPEEVRYYLGEGSSAAGAMKVLLRNLLDWSRSQQNLIKVCLSEFDVRRVIADCEALVQQQLRRKNLQLAVECPETLIVTTDASIVTTVLRNLLVNAVKYSFENGTVTIKAAKVNGMLRIDVGDEGVGMEADEAETLMQPGAFVKSKPGVEGEKGAGLGLMLSRELLEKLPGHLLVSSQKMKGSTFTIMIQL